VTSPQRGPIVVDTNVFGAGLTPRSVPLAERYDRLVVGRQQLVSFQTVMELQSGALIAGWGQSRHLKLRALVDGAQVVWPGPGLTTTCAALRAECWRTGHALAQPEHSADLWIAATAVYLDLPLVTDDGIFAGAPGLRLDTVTNG
jgi:predicted nucleic acid-binding protein